MVSKDSKGRRFALLAATIATFSLPAAAFAGPWAYSVQFGDLIRADLATGATEVVGSTGIAGLGSLSLADDGAGHFYSLSEDPGQPSSLGLYRLNAATGAAVRIGPLVADAIEFGPDGQLYSAGGVSLAAIDPATGTQLSFLPFLDGSLRSLATAGGALYAVVNDPPGCHLDRLEPATQNSTRVIENVSCGFSMAGDPDGRLWLVSDHNGVITGTFSIKVERLDPATQEVELWGAWDGFLFDPNIAQLESLAAVGPSGGVVDVPVAGSGGLALLALGLATVGALLLKRGL